MSFNIFYVIKIILNSFSYFLSYGNYIEALKLIDKAGRGDFINGISNFFLYIVIMLGAVLSLIALGEVENYLDNGVVEKKKEWEF